MENKLFTIGRVADLIGVSIQTLRRWDDSGRLIPARRNKTGHRYYSQNSIEEFIRDNSKYLFKFVKKWTTSELGNELPASFYCKDISVFQARLSRLEMDLGRIKKIETIYPLITAITGEIGNNSFDHNLGNWPDMSGIFFVYDLSKRYIVLADRGQGILTTLKKVKPNLSSHQEALKTAFTEIISGRAPEYRGNGLKFVKEIVETNDIGLVFYTGDAQIEIQKKNFELNIKKSNIHVQGCLALIKF